MIILLTMVGLLIQATKATVGMILMGLRIMVPMVLTIIILIMLIPILGISLPPAIMLTATLKERLFVSFICMVGLSIFTK